MLSSLFSIGGPTHIGLDLGASAVKVVAIRNNEKIPKLIGAGYEEVPVGVINDGELGDPRSLVDIVKKACAGAGIKNLKGISANVGLRGLSVSFHRALLPLRPPDEMHTQVFMEAQTQIGQDLEGWIIDYQILTTPDQDGQVVVIIACAKKQVAEEYLTLIKSLDMFPCVFDCDVFAIANILEHSYSNFSRETILCIDIGKDSCKINLMQEGVPVFLTSNDYGGLSLTESIARELNIDYEQANKLKISASTEGASSEVQGAISSYLKRLTNEIKAAISYVSQTSETIDVDIIDKVALSGGGASVNGMREAFSSVFKTEVIINDPFAQLQIQSKAKDTMLDPSHIYTVATGLALRKRGDKG